MSHIFQRMLWRNDRSAVSVRREFDIGGSTVRVAWILVLVLAAGGRLADAQSSTDSAASPSLTLVTLDYPGATATMAVGINGLGSIVGYYADSGGDMHGFLYRDRSFRTLDYPNSQYNAAYGINNSEVIVGSYITDLQHAYRFKGGKFTMLLGFGYGTLAIGINDGGTIVGAGIDFCCKVHGFINDAAGVFTIDYPGAADTFADGINREGVVVGTWMDAEGDSHGYKWENGVFDSIAVEGATSTSAYGVNAHNTIVGSYVDPGGVSHGFRMPAGKKPFSVDFPGATSTVIFSINDLGEVAGAYIDGQGVQHGFYGAQ